MFPRVGVATDDLLALYGERNHRTSIAVAGFSTRAKPDGAMSVPVRWEELSRLTSGDDFTVTNVRERLNKLRGDPWKGYWSARQRLRLYP